MSQKEATMTGQSALISDNHEEPADNRRVEHRPELAGDAVDYGDPMDCPWAANYVHNGVVYAVAWGF